MKRRDEEAFRNIVALEGGSTTSASTIAKEDFDEIKISIALEQSTDVKRQTMPWFRLILGIGAQAMQQLTAINIICYYLPYVLTESVGIAGALARLLAAVNAMSYLGCTFIGLYLIERWGRRRLMMFGAAGQCCCWLAITILLKFASSAAIFSIRQRQLGGAAVFFFFLFNCFFGIGWQGVSWLYPTEINSTQNRIAGMSYGVATNWLINFGVVFVTPVGIAKLGWHFYVIWTVLNALMVPLIWLFYPETAGRSLEDIDRMFEANPSVWVFTAKSMTSRKPQTSASCGISGDEAGPSDRTEEIPISFGIENAPTIAFSRQASAIELSALGGLRHRQLGPLAGTSSTSVEDVATALDGRGENAEVVFDPVPCDTNDEGEGEGIAMARAATVLSAQSAPTLGTQMSTTPLL